MSARLVDLAVDAVADYIESNYATYLRIVETELGLASDALTDPKAYVRADLPFDNRNPRIDVFEEDWNFSEDDNVDIHAEVGVAIVWSSIHDAGDEEGELIARRNLTALIKCLWSDRTLGGAVKAVLFRSGSAGAVPEDERTRHIFKQDLSILLQETM
jgi:hypothetical protein